MSVCTGRGGTWYILKSSLGFALSAPLTVAFGSGAYIPVVADYDGDGRADLAIYNAGDEPVADSVVQFGVRGGQSLQHRVRRRGGDVAVPADFDGDGRADFIAFRAATGTWYLQFSGTGYAGSSFLTWGQTGDIPVVGDYDADGKADLAVFRPATDEWRILTSSSGYDAGSALILTYGQSGDIPVLKRP